MAQATLDSTSGTLRVQRRADVFLASVALLLSVLIIPANAPAQTIPPERVAELNHACHDALRSNWPRWTMATSMVAVGAGWFLLTRVTAESERSALNAGIAGAGLGLLASGLLFLVPTHSTQSYRAIEECELIVSPATDPARRRVAYRFANRAFALIPGVHETAWLRMGAIGAGLAGLCAVIAAWVMPTANERLYAAAACLTLPASIAMDMLAPIAPVRAAYQLRRGRFRSSVVQRPVVGMTPLPGGVGLALSGSF